MQEELFTIKQSNIILKSEKTTLNNRLRAKDLQIEQLTTEKANLKAEIQNNSIQIRDLNTDNTSLKEQKKADDIAINELRSKIMHVNKGDETSVIALKQHLATMKTRYETAEKNMSTEREQHGDAREKLRESRAENEYLQQ